MKRITVIGAGTMGNGIAHTFAQNDFKVSIVDISLDSLNKALATIEKNLNRLVAKEKITEELKLTTLNNISTYTSLSEGVEEGNEWWISLRASAESNLDVSSIAKQMDPGGGGHPKAAGFTFKSDTNKQIHDFLEII